MNDPVDQKENQDGFRNYLGVCKSTQPPELTFRHPHRITNLDPLTYARFSNTSWDRPSSDHNLDPKVFVGNDIALNFLENHFKTASVTTDGVVFYQLVLALRGAIHHAPVAIRNSAKDMYHLDALSNTVRESGKLPHLRDYCRFAVPGPGKKKADAFPEVVLMTAINFMLARSDKDVTYASAYDLARCLGKGAVCANIYCAIMKNKISLPSLGVILQAGAVKEGLDRRSFLSFFELALFQETAIKMMRHLRAPLSLALQHYLNQACCPKLLLVCHTSEQAEPQYVVMEFRAQGRNAQTNKE